MTRQRGFCFATLMLSVVIPIAASATNGSEVPASCPVTRPSAPAFIPPGPYPKTAPSSPRWFWHGTPGLWTMLQADGVYTGMTAASTQVPGEISTRNKSFWWSPGFNPMWTPEPTLKIERRRLDDEAPVLAQPRVTNAHHESFGGWTMLTMLEFPTLGCWEVTGSYGGDSVTFVVWVPVPAKPRQ
jgi:hypothetical protein